MSLSSSPYLVLLAITFFAFWLLNRYRFAALAIILFANYFFYAKFDLAYLALIPIASTIDFFVGRALEPDRPALTRRLLVTCSILLNVGLIAALKYLPLISPLQWTLPLGASFYAFQSMTYTIDIYRRDAEPTANYLAYLCSASFFPTTLAGPITRLSKLIPQIERTRALDAQTGGTALFLIALGFVKKLLIADYLANNLIDRVFDTPMLYSGAEVLAGVYGYAFQLFYDFSGYTDIALGSALLLGIKLPPNFNRPYAAENIADFWRRWHITLSNWLRDYLFFSLPGKRSKWMPYLNLVITMTIGGLWHGANWNFAFWGLIHGIGLAFHRGFEAITGRRSLASRSLVRFACTLLTFNFVCFAWIFFRSANLETAFGILTQISSLTFSTSNISSGFALTLVIAISFHFLPEGWYNWSHTVFVRSPALVQAGALALLAVAIQYVATSGSAPFIYTRF